MSLEAPARPSQPGHLFGAAQHHLAAGRAMIEDSQRPRVVSSQAARDLQKLGIRIALESGCRMSQRWDDFLLIALASGQP